MWFRSGQLRVRCLCFDPSGCWLLAVTADGRLFILAALVIADSFGIDVVVAVVVVVVIAVVIVIANSFGIVFVVVVVVSDRRLFILAYLPLKHTLKPRSKASAYMAIPAYKAFTKNPKIILPTTRRR